MDERTHRQFDLGIKSVTAALAVIGIIVGLWKYFDTTEKDFRQPYWERQISLYFEATRSAATLATSDDEKKRHNAAATFWELYWGPLALVEDRAVETAMIAFGDCLKENCSRSRLQQLSLNLAHICRRSIGTSWDLKLEELKGQKK